MHISKPNHSARQAFSLIEAAIVLGIIGLVIGGIWIAAASVFEKNRINDTTTALLKQVLKVRHLYNGFSFTDIIAQQGHGYIDTSELAKAPGWISDSALHAPLKGVTVDVQIMADNGWWPDRIGFSFYDIEPNDCVKLTAAIAHGPAAPELFYLFMPNGDAPDTFPYFPTLAACTEGSGNQRLQVIFKR